MQCACFHILAWVLLLWSSASSVNLSIGFTFCRLLWPRGDRVCKVLPVQSQKLWAG